MQTQPMTIREALLAMGYSEQKSGHWLKPIGYQCLSYHEGKNEWANWFRPVNGDEVAVWETKKLQNDVSQYGSYTYQLKSFECFTRTDIHSITSGFELKAIDL